MDGSNILITGANGQVGRALKAEFSGAKFTDHAQLDISDQQSVKNFDWDGIKIIINAAAYTNVDGAETAEGQKVAQEVNDEGVGNLADTARQKDLLLVHITTEYVFDGTKKEAYTEDDVPNPLGVYAKAKLAGDQKAMSVSKYYLVRTSWVIGDGKNFVRTMLDLGQKGIAPKVVNDQIGRPTFAAELARAIKFLIDKPAPYGVYNVTNEGEAISWADLARAVFAEAGFDLKVTDTTTAEYFASKPGVAPRPSNSLLDLSKIESVGFKPADWTVDLKEYVKKELNK